MNIIILQLILKLEQSWCVLSSFVNWNKKTWVKTDDTSVAIGTFDNKHVKMAQVLEYSRMSATFKVTGVCWSTGAKSRKISRFSHEKGENKNLKQVFHFHWYSDITKDSFWEDSE